MDGQKVFETEQRDQAADDQWESEGGFTPGDAPTVHTSFDDTREETVNGIRNELDLIFMNAKLDDDAV